MGVSRLTISLAQCHRSEYDRVMDKKHPVFFHCLFKDIFMISFSKQLCVKVLYKKPSESLNSHETDVLL